MLSAFRKTDQMNTATGSASGASNVNHEGQNKPRVGESSMEDPLKPPLQYFPLFSL